MSMIILPRRPALAAINPAGGAAASAPDAQLLLLRSVAAEQTAMRAAR